MCERCYKQGAVAGSVEEVGKEEDPQMHLAQQHHNGVYLKIKTLKISETGHGGTYL